MKQLAFVLGASIRKVIINGRKITMITQEAGFFPVSIDLDNDLIDKNKEILNKKFGENALTLLEQISKLQTEEEMAEDIIDDFKQSGWRLVRKG